jgi:hypothetical protein
MDVDRREFLAGVAGAAIILPRMTQPKVRFSVIGLNHNHIYGMSRAVIRGGGELVAVYAKEPELAAAYIKEFPQAKLARSEQEVLESDVQLVLSAAIPDERAPIGIRVMQHGKDYLSDKPGITSLEQLPKSAACRRRPGASTRSCTASGTKCGRRSRPASWCRPARSGRSSRR